MDPQSYLRRIEYVGPSRPRLDVLKKLHRKHMLSVPFENLDLHLRRPIVLDQERFYRKIVDERRGGYCYELNGCFAWLLKSLGFRVSMLSARVARKTGGFTPEYDHMTLMVELGQRWLADVGFGDSFIEPKKLDETGPQKDNGQVYQIARDDSKRTVTRWNRELRLWDAQYSFGVQPHKLRDFAARNRYQQTSPNSHFTQGRLISQLTPKGRATLTDKKLVVTEGKRRTECLVKNSGEFDRLLVKYFGLHFDR